MSNDLEVVEVVDKVDKPLLLPRARSMLIVGYIVCVSLLRLLLGKQLLNVQQKKTNWIQNQRTKNYLGKV